MHTIVHNRDTVLYTHYPTQPGYCSLYTPSYTTWIQFSVHTILHNFNLDQYYVSVNSEESIVNPT